MLYLGDWIVLIKEIKCKRYIEIINHIDKYV